MAACDIVVGQKELKVALIFRCGMCGRNSLFENNKHTGKKNIVLDIAYVWQLPDAHCTLMR